MTTDYEKRHPIGRVRVPDPRDRGYAFFPDLMGQKVGPKGLPRTSARAASLITVADRARARGSRFHKRGPTLDQGSTSRCVLFTFAQLIQSGPVMQKFSPAALQRLHGRATLLGMTQTTMGGQDLLQYLLSFGYNWAQDNDQWPGEDYDGTSGRAGAQFFRKLGLWDSFWHLNSAEEDVEYLLGYGPIAAGMDWFTGMDALDGKGYIRPQGTWRGGHEIVIDSVKLDSPRRIDLDGDLYLHQSWGRKTAGAPYEIAKLRLSDWRYLRQMGADSIAVSTEKRLVS